MPRLEIGDILVEAGTGIVGGGAQRLAWEASQMIGLLATGGLMVAGVALQAMGNQPMLEQMGKAAAISGATVAGWVGTEKFLISGTPRPLGQLGVNARRSLSRAGVDGLLAKNAWAVVDERERTVL